MTRLTSSTLSLRNVGGADQVVLFVAVTQHGHVVALAQRRRVCGLVVDVVSHLMSRDEVEAWFHSREAI